MAILSVSNLSKSYKKHLVLDEIELTIDGPGIWALVGPNGTGKTTFLNVITNILPADSGTVEMLGKSNKDPSIFKQVSFLQDNSILFDYLTGYDHLKYVCDVNQIPKTRVQEVAEYVGMENYLHKLVGNYSLGMKQHLLLAMSLVNHPKLLFLDEPLNGLDPTSSILMRKILRELADQGTTILLSSHNLAEIDRVTKQILFLKDGKLIEKDLSEHEITFYHFIVSNQTKAMELLSDKYETDNIPNGLKVQLSNHQLNTVIDLFKEHQIDIFDIEKEVTGSEKLYQEIFEVGEES
ncbi:ABC transporter ATP-binding protein [Fervidibacillus halotolerans]|uniref:ABC transporter ATP-binding protein n=1 Tax=Fervidibacillus halotolerans TaxID=2980027 RepID=A0A9E8RZ01_9BACI|nr:ABC transporter ATP-binding protein [Fervidibacillus halotolerans]WAA12798.1 ABC transporter ATP-binding protein [Fervidibacillus halotolerans]